MYKENSVYVCQGAENGPSRAGERQQFAEMPVGQRVRRGEEPRVEAGVVDQFLGARGGGLEAGVVLDRRLGLALAADGGELDVVALGEERQVVCPRPPAGATEADAGLLGCHVDLHWPARSCRVN